MMSAKQSKFPLIKTAQVADLIPYARNSRTHSDEQITQIAASIKEFGFLNPVIVDGENGIIAGHGRVMAAKKLGMTELPAVEASHLTDAQRRAYIIADNKLALNAGWDDEMLRVEFDELGAMGFDLDLTGFSAGFLQGQVLAQQPLGLTPDEKLENYLDGDTKILRLAYSQDELETVVSLLDKGLESTGVEDYSSLVLALLIGAAGKW
jgi:ParB-like chromosome segregation protein Spo0J